MTVALKSLRVAASMDSAEFVRGAQGLDMASVKAAASVGALGQMIVQTETRVGKSGGALASLERQFLPGAAAAQGFERSLRLLGKQLDTGNVSYERASSILEGMYARFGLTANAAELAGRGQLELAKAVEVANARLRDQSKIVAANSNVRGFEATNVAYQLQDIFSTAALGASPFTVALQQGPQLASVFGNQGAAGAVRTLGAAFAQLASPVSLVTVGLTAALAAGIQYFSSATSGAKETNGSLTSQADLIANVARLWGQATPGLKAYVDQLERAKGVGDVLSATRSLADQQWEKARTQLSGLDAQYASVLENLQTVGARPDIIGNLQRAYGDLDTAVGKGVISSNELQRVQSAITAAINNTGLKSLQDFASAYGVLATMIGEARKQAATYSREGYAAIAGADNVQDIYSNTTFTDGGKTYQTRTFTPQYGPTPTRRPKRELEGDDADFKFASAARSTANAYRDLVKSAQDRVDQMKLEAALAGVSGIAADTLRFKLELLQQGEDKGRSLSGAQVKAIEEKAAAYQKYAEAAATANLKADLLFQREQIGRGAIDQTIASTLKGAGLPVDFSSEMAGIIRFNEQLKVSRQLAGDFVDTFFNGIEQGKSLWESFGDAGMSVLKKLGDSLINDVLNNIFAINGASGGGGGLLSGIFSLFGGGGGSSAAPGWLDNGFDAYAKGGSFANGISGYSSQIVTRPTVFAFARGAGLMGEAGPEAVMPLRRDAAGRLGVSMQGGGVGGGSFNFKADITVKGSGDKELMANMQQAAEKTVATAFDQYRRFGVQDDIASYNDNPHVRG